MIQDKNGRPVEIGSKIKLVALAPSWEEGLPEEEQVIVKSMVGETYIIEEIDENEYPWITKSWTENDIFNAHSIALEPSEMEVVA